ncbi:unnamed protein product [Ambrosiozyma monospora]|uniref:Unnamed protein product n=1 Tax=Ambrosiozyma monospora TaxID=43982 RepID=A0A9W7DFK4_AMBMO|nr:unnamed protein product [Ambrosiozyma monospora]GMG56354.1 unnamed protein product [Ambrosiozyma monospora]
MCSNQALMGYNQSTLPNNKQVVFDYRTIVQWDQYCPTQHKLQLKFNSNPRSIFMPAQDSSHLVLQKEAGLTGSRRAAVVQVCMLFVTILNFPKFRSIS